MMRTVIKSEYQESWFAIPRLIAERYLQTIGIKAFALYVLLSSVQDKRGRILQPLIDLKKQSGMRTSNFVRALECLKDKNLVSDIVFPNASRGLELYFKPQAKKRK